MFVVKLKKLLSSLSVQLILRVEQEMSGKLDLTGHGTNVKRHQTRVNKERR